MVQDSEIEGVVLSSRNDQIKDNLKLFDQNPDDYNLDKKNFTDVMEKSIPFNKNNQDKILNINNIIEMAVLTISGYDKEIKGDKMVFRLKKHPLTKSAVISTFKTLLEPYSDLSNLLAKKDWDSFRILVESSWKAFWKFCIKAEAKPKQNTRTIYRNFQACLISIGDIVCDNPKNMEGFFGNLKTEYPEDNIAESL